MNNEHDNRRMKSGVPAIAIDGLKILFKVTIVGWKSDVSFFISVFSYLHVLICRTCHLIAFSFGKRWKCPCSRNFFILKIVNIYSYSSELVRFISHWFGTWVVTIAIWSKHVIYYWTKNSRTLNDNTRKGCLMNCTWRIISSRWVLITISHNTTFSLF